MRQEFLSDASARPILEREEDSKKAIQRIIQIEKVQGGCIFIGHVLGKIMNVSMMKATATVVGSLVVKTNKEDTKNIIIELFCNRFTSKNHTPIRSPYMDIRVGMVGNK